MDRRLSLSSPVVQVGILSFFIGGVFGYGIRIAHEHAIPTLEQSPAPAGSPGGGGMMGGGGKGGGPAMGGGGKGGGGMMGGGGGAGGAARPQHGAELVRMVRGLDAIEKAQGNGLTPSQSQSLAPVLSAIHKAAAITDKDAEADVSKITSILTSAQQKALQDMAPPARGGATAGRGGAGGAMGGRGGGAPGGALMGGGGGGYPGGAMMGGARPDPEKPFATDRNRQPLEDLLSRLHGGK